MPKFLIGYEIVGHMLVDADNSQAASAVAVGHVRGHAKALEEFGENEYRAPYGAVLNLSNLKP